MSLLNSVIPISAALGLVLLPGAVWNALWGWTQRSLADTELARDAALVGWGALLVAALAADLHTLPAAWPWWLLAMVLGLVVMISLGFWLMLRPSSPN